MSIKSNYILLNDSPFTFTSRKFTVETIGGQPERTLSGIIYQRYTTVKHKWTFTFDFTDLDLSRLKDIFDLHTTFTLIDYEGITYTVIWVGNFEPNEYILNNFEISVQFDEL